MTRPALILHRDTLRYGFAVLAAGPSAGDALAHLSGRADRIIPITRGRTRRTPPRLSTRASSLALRA